MDWDDPGYTLLLLLLFTYTTIYVDSEYALSVPLFMIVLFMSRAWYFRKSGRFKKNIIEKDALVESFPYRPFAYLRTAICEFKNFMEKGKHGELYPVPQYARITYVRPSKRLLKSPKVKKPLHDSTAESAELLIAVVPIAHQLNSRDFANTAATQPAGGISQLLSNLNLIKSDHLKDGLLQNVSDPWRRNKPDDIVDISYLYPILAEDYYEMKGLCGFSAADDEKEMDSSLQIDSKRQCNFSERKSTVPTAVPSVKPKFQPWNEVLSEIRITFFGDSPEHSFVDSSLGTISIPLRDILGVASGSQTLGLQPEFSNWYPIKWNNSFSNHVQVCIIMYSTCTI